MNSVTLSSLKHTLHVTFFSVTILQHTSTLKLVNSAIYSLIHMVVLLPMSFVWTVWALDWKLLGQVSLSDFTVLCN